MTLRTHSTRVTLSLACLLATLAALLLAGCGSGGSTAPDALPNGTTATSTSETSNQIPHGPVLAY